MFEEWVFTRLRFLALLTYLHNLNYICQDSSALAARTPYKSQRPEQTDLPALL